MSKLLPSGAVQVEVDGVIGVHQHLGNGPRQFEPRRRPDDVSVAVVDERRRDGGDIQRKSRDEKRKRYRQQHERQACAALLRRTTLSEFVRPVEAFALTPGNNHLAYDENVETENDNEREE
jgi:hypothetical protein